MKRAGGLKKPPSLRYAGLRAATVRAYHRAIADFLHFAKKKSVTMLKASHLDACAAEYLDMLFQEGDPISYAGHLVSALKRFHPNLRHLLPITTQFYRNWTKTYVPVRATPMAWTLLEAMVGYAEEHKMRSMALLLGLGFDGMLRTSEMLALTYQHVVIHPRRPCLSLVIPTSKTSQGNPQVVLVNDPILVSMAKELARKKPPKTPIWKGTSYSFRKSFDRILRRLGFPQGSYYPYSLRRGGATYHFQTFSNLDLTVQRGRWSCARTARVYIDSGTAQLAHSHWTATQVDLVRRYRRKGRDFRLRQQKDRELG